MKGVRGTIAGGRLTVDFVGVGPGTVADNRTRVYGVGELYAPRAAPATEGIAALHRGGRLEAADGSFMAVIHDTDQERVTVVTDPVGTRKAYLARRSGEWWVANQLVDLPTDGFALDPAGIGSYMTSDGTHGGLTPFDGIVSLPAGAATELTAEGVRTRRYWTHSPTSDEAIEREEAIRLLQDKMRAAVERRLTLLAGDSSVYLSLSGGHDSMGLLGFLREHLPADRLTTFSYRHRSG